MNITDLVKANAASNYLRTSSATQSVYGTSGVAQGLQKADQRIQSQVDTTSAQLSSFGKLKSAVSDAQIGAKALTHLASATSNTDVKTAATNFVNAFNGAVAAARTTSGVAGDTAANQSASRVSNDLQRTVAADTATAQALKQVGISLNTSGKVVVDSNKFDTAQKANPGAVKDALNRLGQQVGQVAAKELAADGNVGVSMTTLNQRSSMLKSQQATLSSLQQNAAAVSNSSSSLFALGLSAYRST